MTITDWFGLLGTLMIIALMLWDNFSLFLIERRISALEKIHRDPQQRYEDPNEPFPMGHHPATHRTEDSGK